MRSARLRPAIPMSGRQDVQSIKPGGRPPQSPSPLTPSVTPDARGPRRRGFKASAPFAGRNAPDRRQREIGRVGHCRMKTPPRKTAVPAPPSWIESRISNDVGSEDRGEAQRMARAWRPKSRADSAPDRHQYGRAAICKYGNIRVVIRTKSLHRRQTRFPLKVWTEAGVVAPARLNLRPAKQRRIGGMWGERTRRTPA